MGGLSAIHFGWRVAFEAVRDFVWADLREGVLDLRGLGSPLRALIWLGFGMMLLVIAAMLQGELWRQSFPLVALTQGIPGGAGSFPPPSSRSASSPTRGRRSSPRCFGGAWRDTRADRRFGPMHVVIRYCHA